MPIARLHLFSVLLSAALLAGGCTETEAPPAAAGTEGKKTVATGEKKGGGGEKKGGGGRRGGRGGGGQAQVVEVTKIARRDLVQNLSVTGSLAANETATIRPEISGLIRSIHFDEGQRVKKNALLVKLDDRELQAQLAQSESRFSLAKLNLERAENLRQTQSNTQADVDRARTEFAGAQADLDLLKVRLARTEVRAPFDGVAEARTLSPGDYVSSQSIITTINDLSRIKVEFQVPEGVVAKVRPGTPFRVKPTTSDNSTAAEGQVYFVNSVIDRATRSSEVKGYLDNPGPQVKAGMFAEVEITLEVRKGALAVPEGAILVEERGPELVTVVERDGGFVAAYLPVKLGLRTRGLVEVQPLKGAIDENVQIVAAGVGSLALFPGARLDPRPLRAEFELSAK
jgi:membrane fusion protein, multidrug efflux system